MTDQSVVIVNQDYFTARFNPLVNQAVNAGVDIDTVFPIFLTQALIDIEYSIYNQFYNQALGYYIADLLFQEYQTAITNGTSGLITSRTVQGEYSTSYATQKSYDTTKYSSPYAQKLAQIKRSIIPSFTTLQETNDIYFY